MGLSKNDLLGCQVTGQLGPNPVLTPVGGADPVGLLVALGWGGGSISGSCSFSQSPGIQRLGRGLPYAPLNPGHPR